MQAVNQAAKGFAPQESFFALLLSGHEAQQVSGCRLASQHANQQGECLCFQHLHRQTPQRQAFLAVHLQSQMPELGVTALATKKEQATLLGTDLGASALRSSLAAPVCCAHHVQHVKIDASCTCVTGAS